MLNKAIDFFNNIHIDAIDQFADKVGLTTIFTSLGLTATQEVVSQPWVLTDYALLISAIGGILFIIEKVFVIYLRYKESRRISRSAKQKKKSRNLPK